MGFDITLETDKLPKPDIKSNASNLENAVNKAKIANSADGTPFGASVVDTIQNGIVKQETDVPSNVKRTTSMDKAAMSTPPPAPNKQPEEHYQSSFNTTPKVGGPSKSFGESDNVVKNNQDQSSWQKAAAQNRKAVTEADDMENKETEKDLENTWEHSNKTEEAKAVLESSYETRSLFGKKSSSNDGPDIPTSSVPNLPKSVKLDIGRIFGRCFYEDPSRYPSRIVDINIDYGPYVNKQIIDIAMKIASMSPEEFKGLFVLDKESLSDDFRQLCEAVGLPYQESSINNIVMNSMQFSKYKTSIFSKRWNVNAIISYGMTTPVLEDYTATIETRDLSDLVQSDRSVIEAAIAKAPDVVCALESLAHIYHIPEDHVMGDNSLKSIKVHEDFIIAPENKNVQGNKDNIIRAMATLLDNIGLRVDNVLDKYQTDCIAKNKEFEVAPEETPSFVAVPSKVYINDQEEPKPQEFGPDNEPPENPEPQAFGPDEQQANEYVEYLYDLYGTPYIGTASFSEMGYNVEKHGYVQESVTPASNIKPEDIKYMRFDNSGIVKAIKCFNEVRAEQSDVKEDGALSYQKIIKNPKFKEGIDALAEQFDCRIRLTLEDTNDVVGYTMVDRMVNPRHKVTISKKSGFKLNGFTIYICISTGLLQFASPKEEKNFGQMLTSVLLHEIFHNITTLLAWDNMAWVGAYSATITRAIQANSPKVKKVLIDKYVTYLEETGGKMNKLKKFALKKQLFALCSSKQIQSAFVKAKQIKKTADDSQTFSGSGDTGKSADENATILIDKLNEVIPQLKDQYKTKPGHVASAIVSWCFTALFTAGAAMGCVSGPFGVFAAVSGFIALIKTGIAAYPAMLRKMAQQFKSGKDLEEQFADAFAAMYKLPVVFHFVPSEDHQTKFKYNEMSSTNLDKLVKLFSEVGTLIMDVHPTDYQRASQAIKAAKQILADGGKFIDPTQKRYLVWLVNGFDSIEDTSVDDVVLGESPVFDPNATADLNKHLENLIQHGRKNINITESFDFNNLMDKREMIITESERPTVAFIDGKVAVLDPNAEEKTWSNP